MKKSGAALGAVALLVAGTAVFGQFGFRGGGRRGGCSPYENVPPSSEFVMVRWQVSPGGSWSNGWEHDYPCAEQHILQVMSETAIIDTERLSYKIVQLGSPEVFDYPFAYLSHPGDVSLTDQEVENMREYLNRGGFIMMDDFGGQDSRSEVREWNTFVAMMDQVFPDREPFELTLDHPIFHNYYDISSINLVHPMTGTPSVFIGYPDGEGGLAAIVCFRNDVGDFWEFIDDPYSGYPVEPSAEALKLGLNFVHWALTH